MLPCKKCLVRCMCQGRLKSGNALMSDLFQSCELLDKYVYNKQTRRISMDKFQEAIRLFDIEGMYESFIVIEQKREIIDTHLKHGK